MFYKGAISNIKDIISFLKSRKNKETTPEGKSLSVQIEPVASAESAGIEQPVKTGTILKTLSQLILIVISAVMLSSAPLTPPGIQHSSASTPKPVKVKIMNSGIIDNSAKIAQVAISKPEPPNPEPPNISKIISNAASEFRVPEWLLDSIPKYESGYNNNAVSYRGAVGMFQIMPKTGTNIAKMMGLKDFKKDDLKNPEIAARMAARYLGYLMGRYNGNLMFVLAAYNWGEGNVDALLLTIRNVHGLDRTHIPGLFFDMLPNQTKAYIRAVAREVVPLAVSGKVGITPVDTLKPAVEGPDTTGSGVKVAALQEGWINLETKIRAEIDKNAGLKKTSIVIKELSTGKQIQIGENELFDPASTIKLPIMSAYMVAAKEGRIDLNETLVLKKENVAVGDQRYPRQKIQH